MRPPFVAALVFEFLAGTLFSNATAQQITERQTAFESLADSQWVRLKVAHVAGRYEGRLLERRSDQLVLMAEPEPVRVAGQILPAKPEPLRVAATTIDTLWVKRGSAGRGAGIGALVGLIGGGIAGAVACADCQDTPPSASLVGGAALGAALGALVGAGIGAVSKRWVRQYPK
jgi:hypothetical protein